MKPTHIGFIMDGNRRWAQEHGKPSLAGHKRGQEVLREILHEVFESGVPYATVYAFSSENWSRTTQEVGYLMDLIVRALSVYVKEFDEQGVRVVFLGNRSELSASVQSAIEATEKKTNDNHNATLAICINYGGQNEIVSAVKKIVQSGALPESIDAELVEAHLDHPELPPCDLIVRTSGEQRLSNFMLWRAAYSELLFIDKYWPDMTKQDVTDILNEYSRRNRRFGG